MNLTRLYVLFLGTQLLLVGCNLGPDRVRYPTLIPENQQTSRRAAQVQDPFPDGSMGPSTGSRPLGFQTQRSEPQRVRDRYYNGFLKSNFGTPSANSAGVPRQTAVLGRPLPNQVYATAPQPVQMGGQQMPIGSASMMGVPPGTMQSAVIPAPVPATQYGMGTVSGAPQPAFGSSFVQPGAIR